MSTKFNLILKLYIYFIKDNDLKSICDYRKAFSNDDEEIFL